MKEWIIKAGIRAIKTFAQTLLGFMAVGLAINEIPWGYALSVSTVALIASLLTSIAGLPELKTSESDGEIIFGDNGQSKVILDTKNVTAKKVTLDVLESVLPYILMHLADTVSHAKEHDCLRLKVCRESGIRRCFDIRTVDLRILFPVDSDAVVIFVLFDRISHLTHLG